MATLQHNYTDKSCQSGFTFIELLIVMVIVSVVSGLIITSYNKYNEKQTVRQASLTVKNYLRLTQMKAISADKPTLCDELQSYTFSYISGASPTYKLTANCVNGDYDVGDVMKLPKGVNFSESNSVKFKTLSEGVANNRTVTVSGFGNSYSISVDKGGSITGL